jgi:hypothetical protein
MAVTPEQRAAFQQIANATVEAVREMGPSGAPAGPMFMAFQQQGVSLTDFQTLMDMLVATGRLRRSGHCYFFIK